MVDDHLGLAVHGLTLRYPARKKPALEDISVEVHGGEILAVAGRNGAGKSSLALASGGFIPRVVRASVTGTVHSHGVGLLEAPIADIAGQVGIVFSTPALQLSASKPSVREELAFGLENLGLPRNQMDEHIDRAMARLGISHLAQREPLALSGGEQQRVAIASVLVMGTRLLVLDEPVAQLDPAGASEVAQLISALSADGRTVVVAEHEPGILSQAARCLLLEGGRQVAMDTPGAALGSSRLRSMGLEPPTVVQVAEAAGLPPDQAFDEAAIARSLAGSGARGQRLEKSVTEPSQRDAAMFISKASPPEVVVDNLVHTYAGGVDACRDASLIVEPGSSIAIVGQNGSGKTTLVKHLNGLLRPTAGRVLIGGDDIAEKPVSDMAATVGFVFQSPDDQLFKGRVEQEVAFGPANLGLSGAELEDRVAAGLAIVGLTDERSTNPYDLGLSARKLVALASVLAMEPPVLILDEPTTGQDGPGRARIGAIVEAWSQAERTLIAISHDMEFVAQHFGRIVVMRQGQIILDGPPRLVFSPVNAELLASTGLVPPPAARIASALGLRDVPLDAAELLQLLAAA